MIKAGSLLNLVAPLVLACACTGSIGGDGSGAPAPGESGSGGTTASSGGAAATPTDTPPGLAPVRRLTNIEYNNTVADLLGDTSAPANEFAADVAQDGFTNNALGQNVSPALTEQYMAAAEALSRAATQNLTGLLGCDPAALGEEPCVTQFIGNFGKRAWRRPLSTDEQARLLGIFTTARVELALDVSVQLVLQVFLQAPQFLYLLEIPDATLAPTPGSVLPLDDWQMASRLSYFLLGSMPDPELFAAAEQGALSTPEQVAEQARRLLALPRARDRIGLFFTEWLQLRNIERMEKDPTLFPQYSLELGPLLEQQVQLFATYVILDQGGTAMDLLTAPYTFISPELAPLYGVAAPAGTGFSKVDLDPSQRAGLLTHVGLLASLAKANQTDPIHRGKFVRERLLCDTVPPPPVNAVITPPVVTPDATTRERFNQHRADPACAGCHMLMDEIGLGFEHYDALGQWRDTENGLPVDATGNIVGTDVEGTFDGAVDLAQKLAQSQQVRDCLAQTWFRFAHGRSATAADAGHLTLLSQKFSEGAFKMSELLVAVTQTRAFREQLVPDPNVGTAAMPAGGDQP